MKKGFALEKNYFCAFIYPFGIEILIEKGINIAIIIARIEFNFSIGKNYTIFGDIIEQAVEARHKIKNDLSN